MHMVRGPIVYIANWWTPGFESDTGALRLLLVEIADSRLSKPLDAASGSDSESEDRRRSSMLHSRYASCRRIVRSSIQLIII
jgi:hypothetical protein